MDYKKPENRSDFVRFRSSVITKLEMFMQDLEGRNYKQCANLAYWINDYVSMLKREQGFDPHYLPVYQSGAIVYVNLGFRVGSEHGGAHYAVVLTKNDKKASPVLTIAPLSSIHQGKRIRTTELDIGDELYCLVRDKTQSLREDLVNVKAQLLNSMTGAASIPIHSAIEGITSTIEQVNLLMKRFYKMKGGSRVLCGQVTTISKMRIIDPTKTISPLYGVSLSSETMQLIRNKVNDII